MTDVGHRARVFAFAGLLPLLAGCGGPAAHSEPQPGRLRLVSTAPNLTEIVCAVGAADLLAGRTEACDTPADAVARVPVTGGFGTPWLEPLLAARPTHVLETVLADPELASRLRALGIPVVHVACSKLDEIPPAVLQLGELTGHADEAHLVADRIRSGVAAARAARPPAAGRPRVALLFAPDTPITAGRGAFVSELLELAGGRNIAQDPNADYYHVSLEWLLAHDPEIILCLFDTAGRDPQALFEHQTGWRALAAVRERRVRTVPDLNAVCRPGPRVLEGLAQLKHVLALDAGRACGP